GSFSDVVSVQATKIIASTIHRAANFFKTLTPFALLPRHLNQTAQFLPLRLSQLGLHLRHGRQVFLTLSSVVQAVNLGFLLVHLIQNQRYIPLPYLMEG